MLELGSTWWQINTNDTDVQSGFRGGQKWVLVEYSLSRPSLSPLTLPSLLDVSSKLVPAAPSFTLGNSSDSREPNSDLGKTKSVSLLGKGAISDSFYKNKYQSLPKKQHKMSGNKTLTRLQKIHLFSRALHATTNKTLHSHFVKILDWEGTKKSIPKIPILLNASYTKFFNDIKLRSAYSMSARRLQIIFKKVIHHKNSFNGKFIK